MNGYLSFSHAELAAVFSRKQMLSHSVPVLPGKSDTRLMKRQTFYLRLRSRTRLIGLQNFSFSHALLPAVLAESKCSFILCPPYPERAIPD